MSTAQLCFLVGRTVEPAVSGNKPHKVIRIAKRPEYNPTDFYEYALIVRCKDCEWSVEKDTGAPLRCGHTHGGSPYLFPVEKDSYCSWGKRKVVDE